MLQLLVSEERVFLTSILTDKVQNIIPLQKFS